MDQQRSTAWRHGLELLGLASFAILQPLLAIVAAHSEFLVAHDATTADVLALLAVVALAIPLGLFALESLAGLAGERVRYGLHLALVGILVTLIVLPLWARVGAWPGSAVVAVALATGLVAGWLRHRIAVVRQYLWWTAAAAPVFAAAFLLDPAVSRVVFPGEVAAVHVSGRSDMPVVLIVFDAFPEASLVDADGRIDAGRYPNLNRLAAEGVWFRNATSVSDNTVIAVPAVLSGSEPVAGQKPVLVDHPLNLFTLLADSHELVAFESHTALCPGGEDETDAAPAGERRARLLSDSAVVLLHVLLPADLRAGLPDISASWRDFGGPQEGADGKVLEVPRREENFAAFLDAIAPRQRPPLYFIHAMFPHTPYQFYPSGKKYTGALQEPSGEGRQWGAWSSDTLAVRQSQQRHLLQVGYLDRLVGQVIDRLEQAGLYDNAMIVVTADHGASFRPGQDRRRLGPANPGDILCVPVIMRYPGAPAGTVDDGPFSLVDVLPTMLDAMGLRTDGQLDGRSALGPDRRQFTEITCLADTVERYAWADVIASRDEAVRDRLRVFGAGDFASVYRWGPYGGLVGRDPGALRRDEPSALTVTLENAARLADVDTSGRMLPGSLAGIVRTAGADDVPRFAVVVDDRIAAVVRPYRPDRTTPVKRWGALVPEALFRAGANTFACFQVEGPPEDPVLRPVAVGEGGVSYLEATLGGRTVPGVAEDGFFGTSIWDGKPVRWTDGAATLTVPAAGDAFPGALDVGLASTGLRGTALRILVNGEPVYGGRLGRGRWDAHLSLAGVPAADTVRVEIISTTFVPAEADANSTDRRLLGVAVESVILRRSVDPDRLTPRQELPEIVNANLGPEPPDGVSVSGVHGREDWSGTPVRWTDGHGVWEVPLGPGDRPRSLIVDLAQAPPGDAALTVRVNDTVVYDGPVTRRDWTRRFSLDGVPERERMTIALESSAFVPSGSGRTLGVAVRRLMLLPEAFEGH